MDRSAVALLTTASPRSGFKGRTAAVSAAIVWVHSKHAADFNEVVSITEKYSKNGGNK